MQPNHKPIPYEEKDRAHRERRREWESRAWPKLADRLQQQAATVKKDTKRDD
jgi:hypothetical protein